MNYEDFYKKCRHLIDWRLREWTDAFGSKSLGNWVLSQEIRPKNFEDIDLPMDSLEAHEMFCPNYITEEQIMDFLETENNRLTADVPKGITAEDLGIRVYAPMEALKQLERVKKGGKFSEDGKVTKDVDEILEANEELDFLEEMKNTKKGGHYYD